MGNPNRDKIPASLQEIAEVVGDDNAMKMVQAYGGTRVFVPQSVGAQHKLSTLLGFEQAKKLSRTFGGEPLTIARCTMLLKHRRNEEIRKKYDEGASVHELVREYGLTERRIYSILSSEP